MSPDLSRSEDSPSSRVIHLVRLAGVAAFVSGVIGGLVWFVDLADRSDGDDLRWGFWHNPFMQFFPFDEPFLDASMWILFVCSAAVGVGGLLLLVPRRWAVPLITWQARVSLVINGVIACFIAMMMYSFAKRPSEIWDAGLAAEALMLRLGAIAVDVLLWGFVGGKAVRELFVRASPEAARGFDVIVGN